MIKNQSEYRAAMRKMIRMVQHAQSAEVINKLELSDEDAEILSDCIESGFVRGTTTSLTSDGRQIPLRTMDGKSRPIVYSTVITMKGVAFLNPDRTAIKSNLAIILSLCSLLVACLSNLDKIMSNITLLLQILS